MPALLPGVTAAIEWDDDRVFSAGGKMCCVAMLEPPHRLSFKYEDGAFAAFVEREGIVPTLYVAGAKRVSLESRHGLMDWRELKGRLRRSYDLVREALAKKARAAADTPPPHVSARRSRTRG
jgi:predicted DNA-binding protein (MmcQ/YjbR family)